MSLLAAVWPGQSEDTDLSDMLATLGGHAWSLLGYLGPFFFVLALVIFVHELGHYLIGRWCGVGVEAFSIGFGPKLLGWRDGHGTEWKICAIPLGGYVKFRGDLNGASMPDDEAASAMTSEERRTAFQFKPIWQRSAIVAAGPVFNFILAFFVFVAAFMFSGHYMVDPVIETVVAESPADKAGIKGGDRVVSINGETTRTFEDVRRLVVNSDDRPLSMEIVRGSSVLTVTAEPRLTEQKTAFGILRSKTLGVTSSTQPEHQHIVYHTLPEAAELSVEQIGSVITQSVKYIGGLIAGREKADQLSGPIRIAQVSGKVAESGFVSLLTLAAILSISIGFVNLLPIPLLDGGHLMFYAVEAVFGKPLSRRTQEMGFRIGLVLVGMLMLFVTINDIVQLQRG